jgi:small-conductance mechanosensitive channel
MFRDCHRPGLPLRGERGDLGVRFIAVVALCACLLTLAPTALRAQTADFSGEWQTFWRTGSAVLSLEQDGERVTGSYQPDDGVVEGVVDGDVLRATWEQAGASGSVVFALSEDGQVLTGRFDNGEYWNGFRDDGEIERGHLMLSNATPRDTLRSLLTAANAATYEGNGRALRRVSRLVMYAGPPTTAGDRARRRTLMFDILDMSTLRLVDVPTGPETPDEEVVRFPVGPKAVPDKVVLTFARGRFNRWRLVLPDEASLAAERARLLGAMGYESMAELDRARANSPRTVLRDFILGAKTWDEGGRERALAAMDLSQIPERLHELDGPIYADFLRRILARIGFVTWQEVPDDPDRGVPYVYFQHPVGNVTIARVASPPSEAAADPTAPPDQWKITADTLASAPALLEAMKDLPTARALDEPEPLSSFFRLREDVRAVAPALIADWGYLELWQWLGFAAALIAAFVAARLIQAVMRGLARLRDALSGLADLALPSSLVAAALILETAISRLGLTQVGLPLLGSLVSTFLVVALALLAYRLVTVVGSGFIARAQKTTSYVDEIASSLGTALLKLLIVVGAIIAVADVVGLPYEGVLTGLGVGGVAIAFAARDTVSNMMGGGILMADRPFQRGDLIELDGNLATVEEVGLRSTKLRALDDTMLHVPNSQLSDRTIANWGKRRRRKTTLVVGLTYDTPRAKFDTFVRRLRQVVLEQPTADPNDVYVGLSDFGASSIDIQLLCHFRVADYAAQVEAQHALIMDIIALAEEVGVSFAFPTRTVHVQGGAPLPAPSEPTVETANAAVPRAAAPVGGAAPS